jgi:hypothetical protein
MMIGYNIYDCFTMEHFRLRQRMTLTTKIYCSRLYLLLFMKLSHRITLEVFSSRIKFYFLTLIWFLLCKLTPQPPDKKIRPLDSSLVLRTRFFIEWFVSSIYQATKLS